MTIQLLGKELEAGVLNGKKLEEVWYGGKRIRPKKDIIELLANINGIVPPIVKSLYENKKIYTRHYINNHPDNDKILEIDIPTLSVSKKTFRNAKPSFIASNGIWIGKEFNKTFERGYIYNNTREYISGDYVYYIGHAFELDGKIYFINNQKICSFDLVSKTIEVLYTMTAYDDGPYGDCIIEGNSLYRCDASGILKEFNLYTKNKRIITQMPFGTGYIYSKLCKNGDTIYWLGGEHNRIKKTEIFSINIISGISTKVADFPIGINQHQVYKRENGAYIIGGYNTDHIYSQAIYYFDFSTNEIEEVARFANRGPFYSLEYLGEIYVVERSKALYKINV